MMKKLGDLFVNVSSKGVEATNAKLGMTEKKATMASKAAMMLKTALLGIGAAVIIRGLKSVINEFTKYGVEIDEMMKKTGATVEWLQRLRYACDQEHASFESLNKGLRQIVRAMDYARDNQKMYIEAFDRLNITVTDANGNLRDMQDVFMEVGDKLGEMENLTEASAIALRILGRSGGDLIPLFKLGRAELERLGDEAEQLGIVLDEKTIRATKLFDDEITILNSSIKGATFLIAKGLIPTLQDLTVFAIELIKSFTDWKWLIPDITQAITGQVPEVDRLTSAYSKLDDELQDIIEREGKYSIEVMAKLLELDEKLRQAELKRIGGLQTLGKARDSSNLKLEDALFLTPGLLAAAQDLMTYGYIPEKKILAEMKDKRKEENDEKERSIEIDEDLAEAMIEWNRAEGTAYEKLEKIKEKTKEMIPVMQEYLNVMLAITYNLPYKIEQTEEEIIQTEKLTEVMNGLTNVYNTFNIGLIFNAEQWQDWSINVRESIQTVIIKLLALMAIAKMLSIIPGVGSFGSVFKSIASLGGLFQTPQGDAFAYREGRDFGRLFFGGFNEQMNGMLQGINVNQQPTMLKIYAEPGIIVEKMSTMPLVYKSKFNRDVINEANELES